MILSQKLVELSEVVEVLQICSRGGLWDLGAYLYNVGLGWLLVYDFGCKISHFL